MERSRLKTVLIIMLALLNGFLAAHLLWLRTERQIVLRHAEESLTALFAADGISLPPGLLSRTPPRAGTVLLRDSAQEADAAVFFLGDGAAYTVQGDTRQYVSGDAAARFYPGGGFTVTGLDIREGAEALCREFCRAHDYEPPEEFATDDGVLPATAQYAGLPVYDCQFYFSFKEGVLREVLGTLLPRSAAGPDAEPLTAELTAAGALALFQAQRDSRTPVTAVQSVSPCWSYESDGTETAALVPVWQVQTDGGVYYVNCASGVVSGA